MLLYILLIDMLVALFFFFSLFSQNHDNFPFESVQWIIIRLKQSCSELLISRTVLGDTIIQFLFQMSQEQSSTHTT